MMPSVVRRPLRHGAHAVPHADLVRAARPARRARTAREHDGIATPERDRVAARLHARALLDEQEITAGEVGVGTVEHHRHLEREHELAVEVLMERVPATRLVAEQQRRRPALARGRACPLICRERSWEARRTAERFVPTIRDRREHA
jgi:hypothetical protein